MLQNVTSHNKYVAASGKGTRHGGCRTSGSEGVQNQLGPLLFSGAAVDWGGELVGGGLGDGLGIATLSQRLHMEGVQGSQCLCYFPRGGPVLARRPELGWQKVLGKDDIDWAAGPAGGGSGVERRFVGVFVATSSVSPGHHGDSFRDWQREFPG